MLALEQVWLGHGGLPVSVVSGDTLGLVMLWDANQSNGTASLTLRSLLGVLVHSGVHIHVCQALLSPHSYCLGILYHAKVMNME